MNRTLVSGHPRTGLSDFPDIRTDNGPPFRGQCPVSESGEYEVIWSQSLYRAGLVPGLSSWLQRHDDSDETRIPARPEVLK